MKRELRTSMIHLRRLSVDDVNARYLGWLNDPLVMAGIATADYTMEKLYAYVQEKTTVDNAVFFAIIAKDTDLHIGNIKLDFIDKKAQVAELGIMIGDRDYWGRGVGFDACSLAIDYGFHELGLRKIWLAVYQSNPQAMKLYQKLGFQLEGTLRKHVLVNGEFVDKYLMGLFKEERL